MTTDNTIQIINNATKAKLIAPPNEAKVVVTELLSYYVEGYDKTNAFKAGRWDGRSTMFDWKTGTFPVGFKSLVNAALHKAGFKVINVCKPLPRPLGRVPETLGGFSYTDKYDYQWKGVEALAERGMCIFRYATGAGKTMSAALATSFIGRPTLILTKRQPLLYQFWERMGQFGFNPGIVGDGKFLLKNEVTVAMAQTLSSKLAADGEIGEATRAYLQNVEFIIGEEVHEISDNSYYDIIKNSPNAYYKLGLTATPFMYKNTEANMRLLGAFGPVGMEVSEKLLIGRGINAKPYFKFATYEKPPRLKYGSGYLKAVHEGISQCEERNRVVVEYACKAAKRKLPTLILIQRKEHGRILKSNLKDAGLKAEFIFGETDSHERRATLTKLKEGKLDVLIGSKIFDVGIDCPAIGLLINAGGGKAEVSYRQRIGRALRAKTKGPNVAFILDFNDSHNRYLQEHYEERLKIVRGTAGYAEGLLTAGQDFPWND